MWTFSTILCLSFLTFFPTAWIVRSISQGFWSWSVPHAHILIGSKTVPEIETAVYISLLGIGVCIFIMLFQLADYFRRYAWRDRVISAINNTFALYILMSSGRAIIALDQIHPILFICCMVWGIAISRLTTLSPYILESVLGLGFLRYSIIPIIELDIGNRMYFTVDNVLRYGVPRSVYPIALGVLLVLHRRVCYIRMCVAWFTIRRISYLMLGSIIVSLLHLMTKSYNASDTFFTMLPAYHALGGGTLLVSAMSQYGLLYLAPWIVWLAAFPQVPVSFQVGTFVTMLLLCAYFFAFIHITSILLPRRALFILTVTASYYFTILVRYTSFSDMVSVVSTPAFTPLRFGIFIIPLWFLVRLAQTGKSAYIYYFIVCTSVLFFYSFEIGTGLVASAFLIVLLYAQGQSMPYVFILRSAGMFICSMIVCLLCIIGYTYISLGVFPDFSLYWFFAKLFGSGFLTTPMRGATVGLLPLVVSLIGLFVGLAGFIKENKLTGLIMCYLALIELVLFPYYTGRSMNQTIYSISLPFLLLCAMLFEYEVARIKKNQYHFTAWAVVAVCGMVLITGWSRGFVILMSSVAHSAEIAEDAGVYLHKAFTHWDILESREYLFCLQLSPKDVR